MAYVDKNMEQTKFLPFANYVALSVVVDQKYTNVVGHPSQTDNIVSDHLAMGHVSSPKALFSSSKLLVIEHFSGT